MLKRSVRDWILLIIGSLLTAVAFNVFLVPNGIAPGGVSGIAVLLHYIFDLPVGALMIAINVPLFLIGFKEMGMAFSLKTAVGTALLSVAVDVFNIPGITGDLLLSGVYGGILLGAGLGLVFVSGGSTGGTDIAAKVINKRFPFLAMGTVVFLLDFVTISAYGIKFGIERALYSLVTVFLSSRIIDLLAEGAVSAKAYFIISAEAKKIAEHIHSELERGVTALSGRGMYTGAEKEVLICLVNRYEAHRLKRIISRCDEKAFVFIADAREVMGEGFTFSKKSKRNRN